MIFIWCKEKNVLLTFFFISNICCIKRILIYHYFNGDNMKKILIVLAFLILGLTQIKSNNEELITIPKDSIRVRIIANSNSINDQNEKNVIKKEIQMYLEELLKDSSSKEETKKINVFKTDV